MTMVFLKLCLVSESHCTQIAGPRIPLFRGSPRTCIPRKFPGGAEAAQAETELGELLLSLQCYIVIITHGDINQFLVSFSAHTRETKKLMWEFTFLMKSTYGENLWFKKPTTSYDLKSITQHIKNT